MKNGIKEIPFEKAAPLIRDADILLYRGKGVVSRMIQAVTDSIYSHVGIAAAWHGKTPDSPREWMESWSVLEFREFRGGRQINLLGEVQRHGGRIDVYRFPDDLHEYFYDELDGTLRHTSNIFDRGKIVRNMRLLTGLPYDYRRILCMYAWKTVVLRALLCRKRARMIEDRLGDRKLTNFVCSTAVEYAFRLAGYQTCQNIDVNFVVPGDIGKSTAIHYLFTLTE